MKKTLIARIYLLSAAFMALALLFVYYLYTIQIRDHAQWVERGEANYIQVEKGVFKRGTIYVTPRIGDPLPAATTESGYILAIDYRSSSRHPSFPCAYSKNCSRSSVGTIACSA